MNKEKIKDKFTKMVTLDTEPVELFACLWSMILPTIAVFGQDKFLASSMLFDSLFKFLCTVLFIAGLAQIITMVFKNKSIRLKCSTTALSIWLYLFLYSLIHRELSLEHNISFFMNSFAYAWVTLKLVLLEHTEKKLNQDGIDN